MRTGNQNSSVDWYRVPTMWLVVAIPALSVLGGVVMISLALNNNDGLVVDDYYKHGMEINRVLDRDHRASKLGIRAQFQLKPGTIEVRLFNMLDSEMPATLQVELLNATRQGQDRRLTIGRTTGGNYLGALESPPPGRWYLTLGTPEWRLTGPLQLPGAGAGMLVPASY